MTIWARHGLAFGAAVLLSTGALLAQTANRSSAQSAYYGSVSAGAATNQVLKLSLDDAIRMGIEHNLALVEAHAQQAQAHGQSLQSLQSLLPTITAQADTGAHQFNLASEGFSPGVLREIAPLFPQTNFSNVSLIVKVDSTDAMLNYSQTLFSLSTIDQYRAAKAHEVSAYYATQSSRGLVVLNVGNSYLETLAAGAQVDNAQALLQADKLSLDQAVAQHQAGTAANVDELRARVAFESQQQTVIAAQDTFEKEKIALNREIGLSAAQQIQLTDAAPYSELAAMQIDQARAMAYQNRQDYQGLLAQIRSAQLQDRAAKWERLPTLSFGGNYGVTGLTHGLYHGTFAAIGTLRVPLFEEARFRGDREVAAANLTELNDQMASLKQRIDQQLRDSMLDMESTGQLVRVAQSNVDLAQQALDQTRQRFTAGIDDNLPVVEAEATLAAAESNLVDTTVEYNEAKLGLARNLGIVDTQYRNFLHGTK